MRSIMKQAQNVLFSIATDTASRKPGGVGSRGYGETLKLLRACMIRIAIPGEVSFERDR